VKAPGALADALFWCGLGYYPIPVPFGEKRPVLEQWPLLRLKQTDLSTYFANGPMNHGVLQGVDGRADIDCDCPEAIAAWPEFAPETGLVFGRKSAPRSHSFYVSNPALRSAKYQDTDKEKTTLVELRALKTNGQVGMMTMVPHSVHPTGEPGQVDGAVLDRAVAHCAAAALLARHCPGEKGGRHDAFLALAGTLAHGRFALADAVRLHRAIYRVLWPDNPDLAAAEREVETTYQRYDDGHKVTGLTRLSELIGKRVVSQAVRWLKLERPAAAAKQARSAPRVLTCAELLNIESPPAEMLFEGYPVSAHGLSLMVGVSKGGKTVLAVQQALAVATNKHLFDNYTVLEPGPVLIVERDDPAGAAAIKPMVQLAGCGPEAPLYVAAECPTGFGPALVEWLEQEIRAPGP
jgi:hypothetical protein